MMLMHLLLCWFRSSILLCQQLVLVALSHGLFWLHIANLFCAADSACQKLACRDAGAVGNVPLAPILHLWQELDVK